jgi:hypothetical protein
MKILFFLYVPGAKLKKKSFPMKRLSCCAFMSVPAMMLYHERSRGLHRRLSVACYIYKKSVSKEIELERGQK